LKRLGVNAITTDDTEEILSADKIIFPGVGAAGVAMEYLREKKLDELIKNCKQPFLGICLGMQLLCRYSEENDTTCLGIFDEHVRLFNPVERQKQQKLLQQLDDILAIQEATEDADKTDNIEKEISEKVPQIGWNNIYDLKTKLFKGIAENSYCYFVHSYYAALGAHTIATTNYVQPYSSGLHRDNFYGVQFHPEKSASVGEKILKNFLEL